MTKNNTPALRFSGFDGEWNVISLSDNATFSRGKGYSKADVGTGSYPLFLYGQLYTNYSTEIRSITTFSRMNDDSVVSTGREVLMPASDVTPTNIVRASHLKVPGVLLGGDLNVITPGDGIDPTYLALELTWGSGRAELLNNIQGATVKHLHLGPIRNLKLVVPSVKEQRAIGELFADLDALIEQHRAKHANLQQTKTALMQRIFPQDGADEPELRLDGFRGAWEKVQIQQIADVVGGGTPSTSVASFWDGHIDWYSPNEIGEDALAKPSNKRITFAGLANSSAKMLPAHRTILFTSRASIGHAAILDHPATTNQGFQSFVLKNGVDTHFIYALTPKITEIAEQLATGSTFLEVSNKTVREIEVGIPTLDEQRAIGEVFANLDALIAAEANYITQLTQAKTALLQRMFV